MKFNQKKYLIKFIIISTIFLLDRISKVYVLNLFNNEQVKELTLNNFLNLHLIWNEGVAFGLLNFDNRMIYIFITSIILVISIVLMIISFRINKYSGYIFAIITGGALGNLFDRLYYSAVPDFIDFHINNYHWFIFNVADIFISFGVICLILDELLFYKKENNEKI
jgi:signal peptidase II